MTPIDADPSSALILELARGLHEAGMPSDSLEATIERTAKALGIEVHALAYPTSFAAAVGPPGRQEVALLRLDPGVPDLDRMARLDRVVDLVCAGTLSPKETLPLLRAELARPLNYPALLTTAGYSAASAAVAVLLGGGWDEVAVAAAIGLTTGGIAAAIGRIPRMRSLFEILAATFAAIAALLAGRVFDGLSTFTTIAAGVVVLLPGLSLTTGINELATRNLVSGTARLGGVLAALIGLTAGVALGSAVGLTVGGVLDLATPEPLPDWVLIPVVLCAAFGFGVTLNGRPSDIRWILPSCALAVAASWLTEPLSPEAAAFVSALMLGVCARIAARFLRPPAEVLLLPGLIILVPGVIGYQSLLSLLQDDVVSGVAFFFNMLMTAILLVAGLLLAQFVPSRRSP